MAIGKGLAHNLQVRENSKNKEYFASQWGIIKDQKALRPIADRILIKEDDFQSRFDCTLCHGEGHLGTICPWCGGTKYDKGKAENGYCRDCTVGAHGNIIGRTLGYIPCSLCGGKGGTLVTPDDTKNRPTTGVIIAIGSLVTEYNVGANVLYDTYTGKEFDILGIKLRIMRQHDVHCEIRNIKKDTKSDSINIQDTADPENVGMV